MTRLTDLLGIQLPIIQAPMAGAQGSALAAAVSNAGGLGSLPCALLGLDAMRKELATIRAQTEPSGERETVWRTALSTYFTEFGIDPKAIPAGPGRSPFSREAIEVLN